MLRTSLSTVNKIIALLLLSVLVSACSSVPHPKTSANSRVLETGKASYYADKYQSRPTASGEPFNQFAKTAAHKRLPFGSLVQVTNLRNGKNIVVKINDRGPFVRGRIIDLSKSAFSAIANLREGVIPVSIRLVRPIY